MAGMSLRHGQLLQKSIHRFGGEALRRGIVPPTNTTHFPPRNGCVAPTLTVRSQISWLLLSRLQSSKRRTLRAGFWALSETQCDALAKCGLALFSAGGKNSW